MTIKMLKKNLNSTVIPAKRSASGNPVECKALHTAGCPIGSGMTEESGRSLVEMLGVLAIMGILSVAGMSAFKSAMTRHRANELLNEASKRATLAATQFATGKEIASLTEFSQNDIGYTKFNTETAIGDNENQFKITLTAPDIDICSQVKTMIGTTSQIRKINTDCTEISFNKDLSTTVYPSDFNGDKESCEKNTGLKYCLADNTCVSAENDCKCSSYTTNECGAGWYCRFTDNPNLGCKDDGLGHPTTTDNIIVWGVCTQITGGEEKDGHWTESPPNIDYYTANSWCISKGSSGSITFTTLQNAYSCDKTDFSCDWETMQSAELTGNYWSSEMLNECNAWNIRVRRDSRFTHGMRSNHANGISALCE